MNRGTIGQVGHFAAAGFGQGHGSIFEQDQIVAIFTPGFDVTFGHGFAFLEIFREGQAGGLGRHHEIVQSNGHTVRYAASQYGFNTFD